jgi:hypothetical protein
MGWHPGRCKKCFSSRNRPHRLWVPPVGTGVVFPCGKEASASCYLLTSVSTKVKNEWGCTLIFPPLYGGPLMVAQWLKYCAINRKVGGSIPDGVIGIFY